jgi:2'-5' RNA ligase
VTRAFVAVTPSETVLDAVAAATSDLAMPGVRMTTRAQWHLTLQFLGNRADIDAIAALLHGIEVPPGTARLGGAGAFPNARRASVVWVGVTVGAELLFALARAVAARLEPNGFVPEARAYHPHLTLGRARSPTDLRATVAELRTRGFGPEWTVGSIVVYESNARRAGAQYVPRAAISLST